MIRNRASAALANFRALLKFRNPNPAQDCKVAKWNSPAPCRSMVIENMALVRVVRLG